MTAIKLSVGSASIDESATVYEMRQAMSGFFRTSHGSHETYKAYRGFLIVRNRVQFTGCEPERHTVVYVYDPEAADAFCVAHPKNTYHAKKFIDRAIAAGDAKIGDNHDA